MSKQDDDLAELQKFFDQEITKIEKSKQPKKDQEKKSLTETVRQELNIPVEDRYLYDLLGAYAGKRAAGAMDTKVRSISEDTAAKMRGLGFDTGLCQQTQCTPASFKEPLTLAQQVAHVKPHTTKALHSRPQAEAHKKVCCPNFKSKA